MTMPRCAGGVKRRSLTSPRRRWHRQEVRTRRRQPGLLAWSPFFESGGHVRQGAFTTRVSGPRGQGRVRADFYRAPVGATMRISFEGQGEEIILYDGAYVCPD